MAGGPYGAGAYGAGLYGEDETGAFPTGRLRVQAELFLGGQWVDVTPLVYARDSGVSITRGRANETSTVERSTCRLTVNNRSGDFSPRNPAGQWYGQIGRNTPLRVSVHTGTTRLLSPDGLGGFCTTPDSAAVSVVGDLDVRADCFLYSWRNLTNLAYKLGSVGNYSWLFRLAPTGELLLYWSADGTSLIVATSTVPVPAPAFGRKATRATLDVNNGAAGNTVTFYTSDTLAGSWTQLGDPVVTAGVTSIFDGTAPVTVDTSVDHSQFFAAQVRDGIAGTIVANPDFTAQSDGADTFTDSVGAVWTVVPAGVTGIDNARISDARARFVGEVTAWPPRWAAAGADVWVPVEAAGILRRLGQGDPPLKSTIYRGLTSLATPPKAYWPCEDDTAAAGFASALGGPAMTFGGTPGIAGFADFAASAPIPLLNNSYWSGTVPAYTGTGTVQLRFLMAVPAAGAVNGGAVCGLYTTGTAASWQLTYGTGGTLALSAVDSGAASILNTGAVAFVVNGRLLRVSIELVQDGADIDYAITTLEVGDTTGGSFTGTLAGRTISAATRVLINHGAILADVAVGHVSVHSDATSIYDLADELNAYAGETAARRIARLCSEEGVDFRAHGDPDDSAALGPQGRAVSLALIREAEAADLGILYEPREFAGLAYRPRSTLYNQPAAVALDYAAADLSADEPTDDDLLVRNDITVTRTGGSSAHAQQDTGPVNVASPTADPPGVGRYDEQVTVNVAADAQLPDQAGWRLRLGTVDEQRHPVVAVELARANFVADAALTAAVVAADLGDRLTVASPHPWLPAADVTQLIQGSAETLTAHTWPVALNCVPETPWQVGEYDADGSRYSSDGSELDTTAAAGGTSLSVATAAGPLWDDADGDFDVLVAGERCTVTAVTGGSSPQTFTVVRAANGISKTLPAGSAVDLAEPAYYAL